VQSRRRPPRPAPLLKCGTSLKLSDGGPSSLLEAHPGSPVDLTCARRPSLAATLASARSPRSSKNSLSSNERLPRTLEHIEENVGRDGVAAKGSISRIENEEMQESKIPTRRTYFTGTQSFYIPAKVPENEEVSITTTSLHGDDAMSIDTAMDVDNEMDFQFDDHRGTWITANPLAHESRSSLATTTTATSTLMDERRYSQYSHGALTLDTSIASSNASMMSSAASTYSSSTNTTDIYGWEEELDRKSTSDFHPWERDSPRRLPSGGRAHLGPRFPGTMHSAHESRIRRSDGKRKGLLYRVLNLSGRRGTESPSGAITTAPKVLPTTST